MYISTRCFLIGAIFPFFRNILQKKQLYSIDVANLIIKILVKIHEETVGFVKFRFPDISLRRL